MERSHINRSFWKNRRVFITGHTGFKGSWLSLLLNQLGAKVFGYSLEPNTTPNMFDALKIGDTVQSCFSDIRNLNALMKALQESKADVVLHLAAQPIVRRAFQDPIETLSINIMGTASLLEAARRCDAVRAVVIITSDKVYENNEWVWPYRETDPLGGKEAYGVSKACCELVTNVYRHSYFGSSEKHVALATVRAGNIMGGGDWAEARLVPDAIRAFSSGTTLAIRNPAAVRPWQHVLEPVKGYLMVAERLIAEPRTPLATLNFGPDQPDWKPVSFLANSLAECWGNSARWEQESSSTPYEAHLLTLDSSLAKQMLGWKPLWTLQSSINETVKWYQAYYSDHHVARVTSMQIEENALDF